MILNFRTDSVDPDQTADLGLLCLLFCLHVLDPLLYRKTILFKF